MLPQSQSDMMSGVLQDYNKLYNQNIECLKEKQSEAFLRIIKGIKEDSFDIFFLVLRTGYGKTLIIDLGASQIIIFLSIFPL